MKIREDTVTLETRYKSGRSSKQHQQSERESEDLQKKQFMTVQTAQAPTSSAN